MADPQQMSSAENTDGGRTVEGGGAPGAFSPPVPEWAKELRAQVNRCERMLEKIGKMISELGAQRQVPPPGPTLAPDSDLDGKYGDEVVKKNPPRWTGQDFAGCNMSTTSPEYLDCVAEFYDWKADRDDEKAATWANGTDEEKAEAPKKRKYATYGRKSAGRARGWAKRLRAGWKPKSKTNGEDWG